LTAYGTPSDPGARERTASGEPPHLKLGRYEVVRELGKGAMGVVYLAKDPLIGRLVALKTIRAVAHVDDEETKEFQQRFIREAQAAGILNHPSIVTVHDIGLDEASGISFIAMEYVEGNNLKEALAQGRTLGFEQMGDIIAQVADALDFAHAKGIVHRDVKPANVILLDGTRAKITDFGIAKIASGGANLTSTGQFLGTPNYMAPEQIKGAPVDGRTDIFSLGICLYECLTRRKPFGGDSLTSISYKIVHEPFPPLHEINPQIPDGYEEVVANCLAKDPSKRYQRARDVASALRMVIRGEKPVRLADPMLAEETIVTRDRAADLARQSGAHAVAPVAAGDRVPTMEVPFPEVAAPAEVGGSTRPLSKASGAIAAANTPAVAAKTTAKTPVPAPLHKTLTNVRAMPLWRMRIPPVAFIAVVAFLIAALAGAVVVLRAQRSGVPPVDSAAASRVAREYVLRRDGNALLRQGRVIDAYAKFDELSRLAPRSPYVTGMMEKLNAIRAQEEIGKQQLVQAKQKFDDGMSLYGQKKYPEAIARFQESLAINPTDPTAAEYVRLAQQEQQKIDDARAARRAQQQQAHATPAVIATAAPPVAAVPVSTEPAQLTTIFNHPFTDGQIIVRAGGDVVANEALFDERQTRILHRKTRMPRVISVTHSFPAKNADVQIWISVPAAGVQERHTIPAVRFLPGAAHRLQVHYDPASKRFSYELN
jgi:predicted Ser/Thr protein kinase